MKVEQRNIGFNFKALGEILFGASLKAINEQKQQEEEIQKELDIIYEEEKRSGATKRIQELSNKLSEYEEEKEKKHRIPNVKTKAKTTVETEKQNIKKTKKNDREIGE